MRLGHCTITEAYYQRLFDIPIRGTPGNFSILGIEKLGYAKAGN